MTFDLAGLAPDSPAPLPVIAHRYGFGDDPGRSSSTLAEAITLTPAAALSGSETLLPVIRTMVGVAAGLTRLKDITAVVWHPARCATQHGAFAAAVERWLGGGAFPALGLTALIAGDDGAVHSEGLAFFIGRELWIDPSISTTAGEKVKIAIRCINQLVGIGTLNPPLAITGPNGEHLSVVRSGNDGLLRVWGRS